MVGAAAFGQCPAVRCAELSAMAGAKSRTWCGLAGVDGNDGHGNAGFAGRQRLVAGMESSRCLTRIYGPARLHGWSFCSLGPGGGGSGTSALGLVAIVHGIDIG